MGRLGVRLGLCAVLFGGGILFAGQAVQASRGTYNAAGRVGGAGHPSTSAAQRSSGPNIGGRPYPIRTDIAPPTGLIPPAAAYTGISPNGLRTVGPRSRGPVALPIFAAPAYYGLPLPGPDMSAGPVEATSAPDPDSSAAQLAASQDALAEQIRQLSANLEEMKAGAAQRQTVPVPGPESGQPAPPEQAPLKLVLRSGEQLTVKSFAVMNGTVWDFSGQRVRKIPISQVDVPASAKATEAAGGEFPDLSH